MQVLWCTTLSWLQCQDKSYVKKAACTPEDAIGTQVVAGMMVLLLV